MRGLLACSTCPLGLNKNKGSSYWKSIRISDQTHVWKCPVLYLLLLSVLHFLLDFMNFMSFPQPEKMSKTQDLRKFQQSTRRGFHGSTVSGPKNRLQVQLPGLSLEVCIFVSFKSASAQNVHWGVSCQNAMNEKIESNKTRSRKIMKDLTKNIALVWTSWNWYCWDVMYYKNPAK